MNRLRILHLALALVLVSPVGWAQPPARDCASPYLELALRINEESRGEAVISRKPRLSERVLKILRGGRDVPASYDVSDVLAEAATRDIRSKSQRFAAALRDRPFDQKLRTFDVIIIGGGPQAATLAANFRKGRVLIMNDDPSYFGTFSKIGDTF